MGGLLAYLQTPVPVDAAPLDTIPFGVLPTKLPPPVLPWSPALIGIEQWEADSLKVIGWRHIDGNRPAESTFDQRESKVSTAALRTSAAVEASGAAGQRPPLVEAQLSPEPLQLHAGLQN